MHGVRGPMAGHGHSSGRNAEWAFPAVLRDAGRKAAETFLSGHGADHRPPLHPPCRPSAGKGLADGAVRYPARPGLLVWLAYRGWSVLLLAPAAAMIAAAFAAEPLLAHWTETFMGAAARFIAQFFPIFLLGALFGKLMEDTGAVTAIAGFMTAKLGMRRAVLAVVLAGAIVTYGGVSLFVAYFVLGPMAMALFRAADIPRRLMPAAIMVGTSTFTMSALPGTPAIHNTIPMPFFGTTPFAAPGLGIVASGIMLASACGGCGGRSARPAPAARASATTGPAPPRPPRRTRWCVNARHGAGNSTRPRSSTASSSERPAAGIGLPAAAGGGAGQPR